MKISRMLINFISSYNSACSKCGSREVAEGGTMAGGRIVWMRCLRCGHEWEADNTL